jgi:hypothetical protein
MDIGRPVGQARARAKIMRLDLSVVVVLVYYQQDARLSSDRANGLRSIPHMVTR